MRPLCGFASLALLLPTLLAAQQPAHPAAPPAPSPVDTIADTIHVNKQIVVLDLVVTDKQGKLVTNCTREDFHIFENGALQRITHFEAPSTDLKLPVTAPKDHNGRDNWGSAPLTLIVIDEMNTPFTELAYSRYEVNGFLKAQPALMPQPSMVLWLNDQGFHPITPFTRDREALLTAVAKHSASLPSKLMRGDDVERLAESFSALQQIALFSRGAAGSKKIIWIGRGFPGVNTENLTPKDKDIFNHAIHSTLDLLLASRVSVDVIDPTDFLGQSPTPVSTIGGDDLLISADPSFSSSAPPDPFAATFNFNSFIQQTGGRYFFGRNDIDHQIATSSARANSFYTLTYSPSQYIEDGKYRKINIRMSNPNLTAQTKQGYYPGGADRSTPSRKELGFDLYEASVTGMVYTGVGLRLQQCKRDSDGIHVTCSLSLDTGTLSFETTANGSYSDQFIASVSSLDAKSKLLYWSVNQITMTVPASKASLIATSTSPFTLRAVIAPQAKAVRFIVRDANGRIGTADLPPQQINSLSASIFALQQLRKQQRRR